MKTESCKMVPDPRPLAKRSPSRRYRIPASDHSDSGASQGPRPARGKGLAVKKGEGRGVPGKPAESPFRLLTDRAPIVVWTTDRELRFTSSAGGGLARL